jgi:hypothetical protein
VEIIADLHRVQVLCDGRVVADHERLCQTPNRVRPGPCRGGEPVAPPAYGRGAYPTAAPEVEARGLADYDTALGLTDQTVP